MAMWQPIRGLQEPIPIRTFKGAYKNDDDGFALADGYAQDMRNISSQYFPALSLRPPFGALGASLGSRVTGLNVWQGQELSAVANGVWSRWNGSAWQGISGGTGLSTSADCSFANFKGNLSGVNLIMANGVDPVKRYDGTTVQNLANAPAGLNFIEQHDNRLYGAVGNTIYYSALSKADDWSTAKDAGQIVLETNNGQQIVGLKSGSQHLTVYKRSSIHELFGTGPSNFRLIEVASDVGAYSNKAITVVSGVQYFISNRIYRYSGGSAPDWSFSKPIQKYLDGINQSAISKCVAGNNGKNVYFAIPYGTAADCNMVLEYDTTYGVWYVWDNMTVTQFARIANNWYFGDINGGVYQWGTGTGDNGTPTPWKWVSPPYSAPNLARRMNWYNMWFVVDLPAGSTLNVYISKLSSGDTDWQLVKSLTAQSTIQNSRLVVPLASFANSNFLRVKLEGTGPFRLFEFDRQMRIMPMR